MSIKPIRQTEQTNTDFIALETQERGGCLTLASASGIVYATYSANPSGLIPMGIQLNDIEYMNLARQPHRTYRNGAMIDVPCGIVGIGVQGDFITDWIYLIGDITPGDAVYAGPSGMFTNSTSFGGKRIGKFLSTLETDPHTVTFRGLGFSRQYVDTFTKQIVWENNPADRIDLATPGYAKIRVNMGVWTR